MAPFLRIAFNAYDVGTLTPQTEPPICAVKMKESVNTGMMEPGIVFVILGIKTTVSQVSEATMVTCM